VQTCRESLLIVFGLDGCNVCASLALVLRRAGYMLFWDMLQYANVLIVNFFMVDRASSRCLSWTATTRWRDLFWHDDCVRRRLLLETKQVQVIWHDEQVQSCCCCCCCQRVRMCRGMQTTDMLLIIYVLLELARLFSRDLISFLLCLSTVCNRRLVLLIGSSRHPCVQEMKS